MVQAIDSLIQIAGHFDAIVFDQWGVLHDGSTAYGGAIATVTALKSRGLRLAILSNSGKRAAPNLGRVAAMGFDATLFDLVMTSGEALWQDMAANRIDARRLFPIERAPGDAAQWAQGLDVTLTDDPSSAEAILLMGLPDCTDPATYKAALIPGHCPPVLCTNPDRASPRAGGRTVLSPGALAHAHADQGGTVHFYGKPHPPVFDAVRAALDLAPDRILMVGDSLEHDIAGGHAAGWATAFVQGGLHAADFTGDPLTALTTLARIHATPLPTYTLHSLG